MSQSKQVANTNTSEIMTTNTTTSTNIDSSSGGEPPEAKLEMSSTWERQLITGEQQQGSNASFGQCAEQDCHDYKTLTTGHCCKLSREVECCANKSTHICDSVCASERESREQFVAKSKQIEELEAQAHKEGRELEKERLIRVESQLIVQNELEAQQKRTMELAEQLAEKQSEARLVLQEKAQMADEKQAEARRIAEEMVEGIRLEKETAEQKLFELQATENESRRKVDEIGMQIEKTRFEFESRIRELRAAEKVATERAQQIAEKQETAINDAEFLRQELEKTRAEAKIATDLAEKHEEIRRELESEIPREAERAKEQQELARELRERSAELERELVEQRKEIQQTEVKVRDADYAAQKQTQDLERVEQESRETLGTEEEARLKAEALAEQQSKDRELAEQKLQDLRVEEQRAGEKAQELIARPTAVGQEESRSKVIEVFEHSRKEIGGSGETVEQSESHVEVEKVTGEESGDTTTKTSVQTADGHQTCASASQSAGEEQGLLGMVKEGIRNIF